MRRTGNGPETVDTLVIDGVAKRFGGVRALDGVSLSVPLVGISGLIGPNGSGKSTLLNIVTGMLRPTSGEVRLGEVRLDGLPAHAVSRLGVRRTFQDAATFAEMTVRENLAVGVRAAAGRTRRVEVERVTAELLEEFDLGPYAEHLAGSIPFGVARLLGVALAVSAPCSLLCLDEPAAGLGEGERRILRERLVRLAEGGSAVLLVDHNMEFIFSTCERVAVLDYGKVLAQGPAEAVRLDPVVIRSFLGTGPAEDGVAANVGGA